jgi:hypothetical protein
MGWKKWGLFAVIIIVVSVAFSYLFLAPSVNSPLRFISNLFDLQVLYFLLPLIISLSLPFILGPKYSAGKGVILGSVIAFVISLIAVYTYPGELGFGIFTYFFIWAINIITFIIGVIMYIVNRVKNRNNPQLA